MGKKYEFISFLVIMLLVIASSCGLGYISSNIGEVFFIYTALSCAAIFAGITSYISFKKESKESVSSIILVMLYLMFLFIPTIKLYLDIPDFLNGNLNVEEGIVTEAISYKGYLSVNFNEKNIEFWGWDIDYDDFEANTKLKIYYLPRSMKGVEYELIKE